MGIGNRIKVTWILVLLWRIFFIFPELPWRIGGLDFMSGLDYAVDHMLTIPF